MISIEEVPDPGAVDVATGSLYVPVPGVEKNTIVLEPRDGDNITKLSAKSVKLERAGKQVLRSSDISIDVYITDARLAIACTKYDKGSTWYGGVGVMVVGNAITKSMAAVRRRGKMLVGQARYPWIQRVGSTSRIGTGTEERLIIDAPHRDGSMFRLTLQLPRNIDAAKVASGIANRAAAFRLACDPAVNDEMRMQLEALATAGPLPPSPKKNIIVFHQFATCHKISESSAKLAPGGTSAARLSDSGIRADRSSAPVPSPPPPTSRPVAVGIAPSDPAPQVSRLKGQLAKRTPD
jgi:hypothetical protein